MKVWLLLFDNGPQEPQDVADVFATRELAEAASENGRLLVEEWDVEDGDLPC